MSKLLNKRISLILSALAVLGISLVAALSMTSVSVGGNENGTEGAAAVQKHEFLNYDMIMGDKNAPIEIIEYASTTCPHCARFHADILPKIKEKYIDTGKVKIVFRNFIFENPFDIYASSLSRCVSEKKFFPTLALYFKRQHSWVKGKEVGEVYRQYGKDAAYGFVKGEVAKIAKMTGMKQKAIDKCFANPDVQSFLIKMRVDAVKQYEVNSTPTIIVDGKKLDSYQFEAIEEAIKATGK